MEQKLTFKILLQYFSDNKKVIFQQEISSDGIVINKISLGNDLIIETTINGRVLSGECTINEVTYGYEYIYDDKGIAIDLKAKNPSISINESVNTINNFKKSEKFLQVKMNGVLAINNSPELILTPSNKFSLYREVKSNIDSNISTYFLQQQFICLENIFKIENEEETYQINDDLFSFISEFENNKKITYSNIDNVKIKNMSVDNPMYKKVQSMIEQLSPLKELLNSAPRTYKDLKIKINNENTKKTIR